MIPKPRDWRVTFYLDPDYVRDNPQRGNKVSVVVGCVKRFAKAIANEQVGYLSFHSTKVTVGLAR